MSNDQRIPEYSVDVTERSSSRASHQLQCVLDRHITFDPAVLRTYITRPWEPVIYDGMLLAAVVEFCDRSKGRPKMDWPRRFTVSMPVHEPDRWNDHDLKRSLIRALECLTGDRWEFTFGPVKTKVNAQPQRWLPLAAEVDAVIPYSDGLDSLAVSTIEGRALGDRLVRVRVGASRQRSAAKGQEPFAAIPFKVSSAAQESSCRSRGFKFAMISGLAAYQVSASRVIVPESGQGALGPVLVNVAHAHPDRRTHPQFTHLVSIFIQHLLGHHVEFHHPTLWGTKGETLAKYRQIDGVDDAWRGTRSCWQDARFASVDGKLRQCGVCAACLLRRLSLRTAGLQEASDTYVWDRLDGADFWQAASKSFPRQQKIRRDYAVAGVLHLDHLASLPESPTYEDAIRCQGVVLSQVLDVKMDDAVEKVDRLVHQHALEWQQFLSDLPKASLVRRWAQAA